MSVNENTNLSVLRCRLGFIWSRVHACWSRSNRGRGRFFHHISRHLLSKVSHKHQPIKIDEIRSDAQQRLREPCAQLGIHKFQIVEKQNPLW